MDLCSINSKIWLSKVWNKEIIKMLKTLQTLSQLTNITTKTSIPSIDLQTTQLRMINISIKQNSTYMDHPPNTPSPQVDLQNLRSLRSSQPEMLIKQTLIKLWPLWNKRRLTISPWWTVHKDLGLMSFNISIHLTISNQLHQNKIIEELPLEMRVHILMRVMEQLGLIQLRSFLKENKIWLKLRILRWEKSMRILKTSLLNMDKVLFKILDRSTLLKLLKKMVTSFQSPSISSMTKAISILDSQDLSKLHLREVLISPQFSP